MVGKWWIICQGHHRPNKCGPVSGFEEKRALCLYAWLFLRGSAHGRLWNPRRTLQGTECALLGTERQCKKLGNAPGIRKRKATETSENKSSSCFGGKNPVLSGCYPIILFKTLSFLFSASVDSTKSIMSIIFTDYQVTRSLYMSCLFPTSAGLVQIWTCLSQEHPHCERPAAGPACRLDRPQGLTS